MPSRSSSLPLGRFCSLADRGEIRNREYATQIRDFRGLRFGKVTPTDIDGAVEFSGKLFVFIEGKYGLGEMPVGQRMCLERICDAIHAPPVRYCVVLVANHNVASGDVDYGAMRVVKYRWAGQWRHEFRKEMTVRLAIENMLGKYAKDQRFIKKV